MIEKVKRKSLDIKFSGRSSDYISPSFGYGCLLNCSYCYMKRNKATGLSVATNVDDILLAINKHSKQVLESSVINKPNQTDYKYITYDISCNEDFALHSKKYYNWQKIFEFFKINDNIKATLATKIVPKHFLSYNPNEKVRIRFSIMPEKIRKIVEPNTPHIEDRLAAIKTFIAAGYEVHINYSPVIVYKNWLEDYAKLFKLVSFYVPEYYKPYVKAEVIFLTHNINKHEYNNKNNIKGENLLWIPRIQEDKVSEFGGNNIRYKREFKKQYIEEFKKLHKNIIPWNTIRYIF